MQQRQLRLGDILDDYCPRERRVTNHAVVAMIGDAVKQTRCTTCDAEHEYKHAKVPRQRRKGETPAALYATVLASGPKRVAHEPGPADTAAAPPDAPIEEPVAVVDEPIAAAPPVEPQPIAQAPEDSDDDAHTDNEEREEDRDEQEGPIHRRLIRASLPRPEGQQPPARPIPEFTIRQPGGRPNRFRPRQQRGNAQFTGNRSNGNVHGGAPRGMRQGGGRPPQGTMSGRRHGSGRKRSK